MENFNDSLEFYRTKGKESKAFYIVVIVLLVILTVISLLNQYVFIKVKVSGGSMKPTYLDGEVVTVLKNAEPDYGDIIIISGEKSNGDWLIKRLIAKGGDKVKLKAGKVYLQKEGESDYTLLNEPYIKDQGKTYSTITFTENDEKVYEIGKGEYFYLGDNRLNSADSRSEFANCKREQIVGVVCEWLKFLSPIDKFMIDILGIRAKKGID